MTESLDDIFAAEEARRLSEARREIAAEKAAWDAMTPEQKSAHTAAVEAKFANTPADDEDCDMDLEDEEIDE